MRPLTRLFVIVAAALAVPPAAAENYPTRPIRLYVAFPPGGAANIVARLVGQPLSTRLGQPVVVENKPGSGGNIAGELFARAGPDGYSLRALSVCRALNRGRFFILARFSRSALRVGEG
jgi:tripartite-type tricarboxylate transporter receptor subunit TctC